MLSEAEHARISEAITTAEQRTAAEFYCVLAPEVSRYREIPLAWAAFVALVVPPFLALAGVDLVALLPSLARWHAQALRQDVLVLRTLTAYGLIQAGLFALVALLVSHRRVRRLLTPALIMRPRVRAAARRHFTSTGVHLTAEEPHVLVLAAEFERHIEIVAADPVLHAVQPAVWDEAVAALSTGLKAGDIAGGYARAVEICAKALAGPYPPRPGRRDALPNTLLET